MRKKKTIAGEDIDALSRDVRRLSLLLTKGRREIAAAYLNDPNLRNAYLSYFLPANMPKIRLPLDELALHPGGLIAKERLCVLDIGSGPGTAVLGLMDYLSGRGRMPALAVTAVDPVEGNLSEIETLVRERSSAAESISLRTLRARCEELPDLLVEPFDLIVFSNVVNELFSASGDRIERRLTIISEIAGKLLAADGSCVILEPALRQTSRELLMLRDGLRGRGLFMYSPCLHNGTCTALDNPRDWCHEDIPWSPPVIVREIDRRIGLRKDSLKFSYLVLRKDGRSLADVFGNDAFRVVSEPLVSKGKVEFYLCGPGGRKLAMRQDKDRTAANEAFGALRRGMIIRAKELAVKGARWAVLKETSIEILRP